MNFILLAAASLLAAVTAFNAENLIELEPPAKMVATFPQPYGGQVNFTVDRKFLKVNGQVTGLPPNTTLAAIVHEFGDIGKGCMNAGGHYNPEGLTHGGAYDKVRHPGDLGNVRTNRQGVAHVSLSIPSPGFQTNYELMGLALVIHRNRDDLGRGGNEQSLITGNSGAPITCAVLGLARDASVE